MATILLTGANRGLGLEFVKQYGEAGWQVLATCRNPQGAEELQRVAQRYPNNIKIYPLDVADFDQMRNLASELEGRPIDVLLCNAGLFGKSQSFGEVDYQNWQEVFRVNTMAPLRMVELFLAHLLRGEQKIVALMTSRMGSIEDNQSGGYYIYRSSKAALNMVARSLAHDLRSQGVTVVVLHPGWVRTDMGGEHAPLAPHESISSLRQVLSSLHIEKSGSFLNYDGTELPW